MAFLDKTQGANFIPELWADPIYAFYKETNKLANSVDDYSALVKMQVILCISQRLHLKHL